MQSRYDIIVVGGGVIGSSVACQLLQDGFTGSVAVIEKDTGYEFASTPRSAGGIRQLFSTEVNIRMSHYSLQAFKTFAQDMAVDGDLAPIDFKEPGYLFLGNEAIMGTLLRQAELQRRLGVQVDVLSAADLKGVIPELNVEDLTGGVFSPDDGYMDAYSVLQGYVRKAKRLGAEYARQEVAAITVDENGRASGVRLADGTEISAGAVVLTAGAWSGTLAATAGVDLPVVPLRRQLFALDLAQPLQKPLPLTIDPKGVYFRHEGSLVIAGFANDVPFGFDFHWEKSFFEQEIWPVMADRCPNFEQMKLIRGWAGLYDHNQIDHNSIIGEMPDRKGLYVATGFSGHGLMHAPAAGKALSELIRLGKLETIDASPLSPERFVTHRYVREEAVI
ncbi:FAD-binding oxidoreductase [Alicyclobacillaceae bacterium I2511]|nr:FAD-binding oxidoreductase [Alicyclobacillaceae bacterium I2511]